MCASADSTPHFRSTGRCETRTVLVVDDDPELTAVTGVYLGELDAVSVRTSSDPETALDRLDEAVDCVVSDYEMPEMDGLALLETVRASHPDLPFVLFTAMEDERIVERVRDRPETRYVRKGPANGGFEQLLAAVDGLLDG